MSDLLVRGGLVFRGTLRREDLRVRGGRIEEVGPELVPRGERVLDAGGLWVLPGGIDNHVHFREPGLTRKEDFASGSRGALVGGVTTVLEVQNNEPLLTTRERCEEKVSLAGGKSLVHFGFYANLLPSTKDVLEELAPFSCGFKLFMGGSTGIAGITDYGELRELFWAAARADRVVVLHCEEESILRRTAPAARSALDHGRVARPAVAEAVSLAAAVELAREAGARIHVFHLSTARAVDLVRTARSSGLDVSASTCPHYLWLTEADAGRLGNLIRVNPAIHGPEDRAALARGLASGDVEVYSTDHAPHPLAEKRLPYAEAPSGIPSVDLFYPLLLTLVNRGALALERAVDAVSAAPARIHDLPRKGSLEIGMDGDLAIVDPTRERRVAAASLASKSGWTPYEGAALTGWPVFTVVAGHVAFQAEGARFDDSRKGSFVRSETSSETTR